MNKFKIFHRGHDRETGKSTLLDLDWILFEVAKGEYILVVIYIHIIMLYV